MGVEKLINNTLDLGNLNGTFVGKQVSFQKRFGKVDQGIQKKYQVLLNGDLMVKVVRNLD